MNLEAMVANNQEVLVQEVGGVLYADSLGVAERFGKRHDHVVRDIEGLIHNILTEKDNPNFGGISKTDQDFFIQDTYTDSMNRERKHYWLTRDGFSLLVMGFTGTAAFHWKLLYIEAFNKMEAKLRGPVQPITAAQIDATINKAVGAKVLGKIAGTEIVDKSIGEVNKKTHKARTDAAAAEKRIGQLDVELLEYLTLDDTKASYDKANKLYEAMLKDKGTLEDIKDLLSIYWKKSEELVAAWDKLDPLRFVGLMKTHLQNVEYDYGKLEAIKVLEGDFWKAVEDSRQASETVHRLKDTEGLVRWLESLDKVVVMATDMDNLNSQYWYQKGQIDKATNAVELHTATAGLLPKLEDLEKKYEQLTALEGVHSVHSMAENGRKAVKARMERLEGLVAVRGKLEAVDIIQETIKQLTGISILFNDGRLKVRDAESAVRTTEERIKEATEELSKAWEETGGVCPLCGKELVNEGI